MQELSQLMDESVNDITTGYFTQSVSPSTSPVTFVFSEYRT